jgi:S-adenosylmethionine:tRNA ribosyltransferase-isomerase
VIKRDENRLKLEFEDKIINIMEDFGQMPTPPYIKKFLEKQEEYQTIYAKEMGSMAAPTAGLHFDNELLEKIKRKGIIIANVTLHVSYDTFLPINEEDYTKHNIHGEFCEIKQIDCDIINNAYEHKNKVIIVGTTALRTIETFSKDKRVYPGKKITKLYVYPGHKFQAPINGLITNFHLPKSSLLLLVTALYGKKEILKAYKHAITKDYRFFSFGDAMFIRI